MSSKGIKFTDNTGNSIYPCPYYPVGSIYMSVNNINPTEFFGGTWEQIEDRFLLACGSTYKAGATGGEATHKLTTNEMPTHRHNLKFVYTGGGSGQGIPWNGSENTVGWDISACGNSGGDQPHNNMPPYLAVYVWKRTA